MDGKALLRVTIDGKWTAEDYLAIQAALVGLYSAISEPNVVRTVAADEREVRLRYMRNSLGMLDLDPAPIVAARVATNARSPLQLRRARYGSRGVIDFIGDAAQLFGVAACINASAHLVGSLDLAMRLAFLAWCRVRSIPARLPDWKVVAPDVGRQIELEAERTEPAAREIVGLALAAAEVTAAVGNAMPIINDPETPPPIRDAMTQMMHGLILQASARMGTGGTIVSVEVHDVDAPPPS